MAKVTITIEDTGNDKVSLKMESNPPIDVEDDGLTTAAQLIAVDMLNVAVDCCTDEDDDE